MKKRLALVSIVIILIQVMIIFSACSNELLEETKSAESECMIDNSDFYEFIDSDTGIHYWVYSHAKIEAGMGGMTPRLNPDGSIMVTKVTKTE